LLACRPQSLHQLWTAPSPRQFNDWLLCRDAVHARHSLPQPSRLIGLSQENNTNTSSIPQWTELSRFPERNLVRPTLVQHPAPLPAQAIPDISPRAPTPLPPTSPIPPRCRPVPIHNTSTTMPRAPDPPTPRDPPPDSCPEIAQKNRPGRPQCRPSFTSGSKRSGNQRARSWLRLE
jgi:hypothetical protein